MNLLVLFSVCKINYWNFDRYIADCRLRDHLLKLQVVTDPHHRLLSAVNVICMVESLRGGPGQMSQMILYGPKYAILNKDVAE